VKKACLGAAKRAKIGHLTIRDLRRTFGTRLDENNYNDSTIAKLLGHGDHRSVHRYKRAKNILREAVNSLEKQNRAKILPLAQKAKAPTLGKCLKIKSGDEGGRTPDLCIANAALCQTELHPRFDFKLRI
jgi:hypothetical protein